MTHPAFEHIRTEHLPSLNIDVEEYRHRATGARHFHLASGDLNNAFLVAFLTVPQDSTGVAHILEHTSLCGSRKYPVRDPFFMMIRRSLNTFMNAFTASDWTAYPFASQNRKDFYNLLEVYLDAAFFPTLDAMDFAQEGHRVEFAVPDDPSGDLVYKGVVYNEMKGAMSSPVRRLWDDLQSALFPTTTYHYNSGGEPAEIPKLTHADLKAFHARHYHPSNAVIMTYGSFPVEEHQERIESWALSRFQRLELDLAIPDERRYGAPQVVETRYPLEGEADTRRKTHVVLGWLLGHSADLKEVMEANLLSGVLLDHSGSPLRQALETTGLGTAPSELCGLDDSTRETIFACGLEGSDPEQAEAVERLVLDTLERVARDGVPQDQVEAVLHQLELHQREVGGGHFPYGLQLMVKALPAVLHGGDAAAILDIDAVLKELREAIRDPGYIRNLTRRLLLDNPHRVRLTMAPDPELADRLAAEERARLATLKETLGEADRLRIVEQARELKARQEQTDDPEILPKVTLADVPDELKIAEGTDATIAGTPVAAYAQGTNGLVYQRVVVDLPEFPDELLDELPLFCDLLTEVGIGERDYLDIQGLQSAVTGGISAGTSVRGAIDDAQSIYGVFTLSGKALERNRDALAGLLQETFFQARFDELSRLRELVAQVRAHRESSITDNGHGLAMMAATAGLAPCGALSHRWSGLQGLRRLKTLDDSLDDTSALEAFSGRLVAIREAIASAPRQFLVVAEESALEGVLKGVERHWQANPAATSGKLRLEPVNRSIRQGWATNTQVNFCAKAFPTVAPEHPDAAALTVLGPLLRNGFLHRAIREQGGAYGAGASYDPDTAAFRFFSYRDPRLAETLGDFDHGIQWLLENRIEPRLLEEAVLGVIGSIDRPDSPAREAMNAFFGRLHGRTAEQRRRFRRRVLEVGLDDLRQVAERYLTGSNASVAVISDAKTLARNEALGLEIANL